MKEKVLDQLKTQFRPEFLNRVDSLVVFRLADHRGDPRDRRPAAGPRADAAARPADRAWRSARRRRTTSSSSASTRTTARARSARVIQNMIEDPLAEALLLGRFRPARRSCVDKSADAGLTIEPLAEQTPRRRPSRPLGSVARPESRYVCQACGELGRLGGPLPPCGAWDSPRRDARAPGRVAAPRRGRAAAVLPATRRPVPLREVASAPVGRAVRSGIGEVDRVLGGGLVPGAWCSSAVSPGSASPRSCSRPRPASCARRAATGPGAVRHGRGVGRAAPPARRPPGPDRGPAGEGVRVLATPISAASSRPPRAAPRACSSSIPSRR